MLALLADVLVRDRPAEPTGVPTLPLATVAPTPSPTPVAIATPTPPPTPPATNTPAVTAVPTLVVVSIPTAVPTATPLPTNTPAPTPTPSPSPTAAPQPTQAPVFPTPTPGTSPTQTARDGEAARIFRINQDLIRYAEAVAARNEKPGTGLGNRDEYLVKSSYLLASMGVLGGTGDDICSGPATSAEAMELAEVFVQEFDAPGTQFVDHSLIYRDVFGRLVNTDMTALPPDEQIAVSTGALLTVEPYLTRDILRVMELQLAQAGREYLLAIRRGETTLSFPQYLDQVGYGDAL